MQDVDPTQAGRVVQSSKSRSARLRRCLAPAGGAAAPRFLPRQGTAGSAAFVPGGASTRRWRWLRGASRPSAQRGSASRRPPLPPPPASPRPSTSALRPRPCFPDPLFSRRWETAGTRLGLNPQRPPQVTEDTLGPLAHGPGTASLREDPRQSPRGESGTLCVAPRSLIANERPLHPTLGGATRVAPLPRVTPRAWAIVSP
ncbi:proline-rich protein 18-like [Mastomys coucha]|uniref:proline-rich protein 18-like n=1 Tax=Mastomys coucha TaxID=35658 RepID=UPI0012621AA9|nr:proline-rich protein 18-like [Mastomys coucha]